MMKINKTFRILLFSIVSLMALGLGWLYHAELVLFLKRFFYWPLLKVAQKTIFTWPFYAFIVGILIIERIIPADRERKLLSPSFMQDIVWFFFEAVGHALIVTTYVGFLYYLYENHLSFLTLHVIDVLPGWAVLVLAIVLLDFLFWLQHYINHKVPWFWYFHTIHHSQKEVNLFTDFRYHTLEYIVRHTILTVPFLIFGLSYPTAVYFVLFQTWFTRFYHANIRTNLGPLRYILVTPQSHRVHHSIEPKHRDKNFGSLLSVWDFIFRTQYLGFDEYPKTGIDDETFPHEKSARPLQLLITPLRQMWYPFRMIGKSLFKK